MANQKQTVALISKWIDNNRDNLPLNIDSWKIQFLAHNSPVKPQTEISLGRYQSVGTAFFAFYKPISRIGKFHCYEQ